MSFISFYATAIFVVSSLNMNVVVNDNMSIETVQQLFNSLFPFLKIEFFEKETKFNGTVFVRKYINGTVKKLQDFRIAATNNNAITINPNMTVNGLERTFANVYKLQTQVFRKSGKIWLEATITDGWSLEDQNKQGEMITAQMAGR